MTETAINNIAPALADLIGPIAELNLHPQNYRHGDVERIRGSLRRFGQLKPVVVQQSTMNVVAGNHTMKSAVEEGWDQIARVIVDMPDEEAEAFLVADNRTSDLAENDDAALSAILERLMLAGRLEGTGYSPDDVDDMLAAMAALPEVEPEPTQAAAGVTDDALAARFANRSQVALRQFVLMYPQDGTSDEVEAMANRLKRAWGVTSMADVVREALTRATAEPPVEGLTDAERAAADAPIPVEEPADVPSEPAADLPQAGPGPTAAPPVQPATTPPYGVESVALYTENSVTNERRYQHPGCGQWIVPLDDTTVPAEVECPECSAALPTQRMLMSSDTRAAEPGSAEAFEQDLPGAAE